MNLEVRLVEGGLSKMAGGGRWEIDSTNSWDMGGCPPIDGTYEVETYTLKCCTPM